MIVELCLLLAPQTFPDDAYEMSPPDIDPGARQWMADNAMANVAEKFTVELMCERTLDVYRALLVT